MDLVAGFSTAGMFLVVVAGVLAFFLPFYVMGIYNQSKEINNNLETMNENLQTMSSLLADALDKNSRSLDKRIS